MDHLTGQQWLALAMRPKVMPPTIQRVFLAVWIGW
jgi:hypothetical protein